MRLIIFVLCIITALAMPVMPGHAQSPSSGFIAMPQAISVDDVEMASVDFDEAFNMFDNPFLSDVVKLNYQISLLEKMVERQAELQKIKESFDTMGAKFDLPPPPRGICAQLPANAACLKHYPELYTELVSKRRAYYEQLKAEAAAKDPALKTHEGESKEEAKARREREEAERKEKLARAERKSRYLWTNIACISGDCRGVLIASQQQGFRATVREGSRLADGTTVESVSKDGIIVRISGDTIRVRPAPGEGTSGEGSSDPSEKFMNAVGSDLGGVSSAASKVLGNLDSSGSASASSATSGGSASTATASASQSTASPAAASTSASGSGTSESGGSGGGSTGQTIAEPALGPSGLF